PEAVARAIELLSNAQRPLVILGKGAAYARADQEIRSFIETTGVPFLPMSMAKGLLPDEHPQSAAAARSYAIVNADVVLLAGARLNWLLSHGRAPLWNEATRCVQRGAEARQDRAQGALARRDRQAQAAECRAHGGTPQRRSQPDEFFLRAAR